MNNTEIINGIAAITATVSAYQSIKRDVLDSICFEQATCAFLEKLCKENEHLKEATCLNNGNDNSGTILGNIEIPMTLPTSMWSLLQKELPLLAHNQNLSLDAKIDFTKAFSILINVDGNVDSASHISRQILIKMLKENSELRFRCGDFVTGGNFFSSFHKIISLFPAITGGKVYTKQNEFSELVKNLEVSMSDTMTKLGGAYSTVEEYNKTHDIKLNNYLIIICINNVTYQNEDLNRLRILIENGKKNGMSFIIIGTSEVTNYFSGSEDFNITCLDNSAFIGSVAKLPFNIQWSQDISDTDIEDIINSLQSSGSIDTLYENHSNLHTEYFAMDSTVALRIPFAIDNNNLPIYFEIGGNAPTHALIAGSTGSGKSVALHTLIMQIIHNYHPDDVEIWAIDYKAVEFAHYLDHRSPHFRVIAHDTSNEFSLSLIDLLYEEYEKRQQEFLRAKVKNINEYRRVCGKHSMSRIVVIIDEFQLMTQAVQEYTGTINYRTRLENLLKLTRAMGISFVLCSQTIASGLSGLSDAARDQIGCRLCLKHDDDNEIRETLVLSGTNATNIADMAKELRRGQAIYKRARWANEHAPDGKAYEFIKSNVLFIKDSIKDEMIDAANSLLQDNYKSKDVILVRGGGRIPITDKERHPLVQFMHNEYEPDDECIEWYPAAPTTLADHFCLEIENVAAANIMLIGEDDELRESIIVHSICGFLMNPHNRVVVTVVDENHPDRERMVKHLKKIQSDNLKINIGAMSCLKTID